MEGRAVNMYTKKYEKGEVGTRQIVKRVWCRIEREGEEELSVWLYVPESGCPDNKKQIKTKSESGKKRRFAFILKYAFPFLYYLFFTCVVFCFGSMWWVMPITLLLAS